MVAIFLAACGQPQGSTACDPPPVKVVPDPKAAGCVVIDGGKLLLVQSTSGRWSIPGGYLEPGEDTAAAAVRETREEASVDVAAGPVACVVPKNRFVAHRCTLTGPASPYPDRLETRAARFLTRSQVASLKPTELRFPDQQASYLRLLDAGAGY